MSTFSSCSGIPRPCVVALVVMALLASGLVLLGFAPDSGSVTVPEGAKAGDLVIHRCDYATEDASQAADCGTLVVPQNRADPQSRLSGLPVIRLGAQSDQPAEPVFYLEGGPGHHEGCRDGTCPGLLCLRVMRAATSTTPSPTHVGGLR
jgi:hypothetical protein